MRLPSLNPRGSNSAGQFMRETWPSRSTIDTIIVESLNPWSYKPPRETADGLYGSAASKYDAFST